jgi:hypothetical protein
MPKEVWAIRSIRKLSAGSLEYSLWRLIAQSWTTLPHSSAVVGIHSSRRCAGVGCRSGSSTRRSSWTVDGKPHPSTRLGEVAPSRALYSFGFDWNFRRQGLEQQQLWWHFGLVIGNRLSSIMLDDTPVLKRSVPGPRSGFDPHHGWSVNGRTDCSSEDDSGNTCRPPINRSAMTHSPPWNCRVEDQRACTTIVGTVEEDMTSRMRKSLQVIEHRSSVYPKSLQGCRNYQTLVSHNT